MEHLSVEKFLSPPYLLPTGHFKEVYAQSVLHFALDPVPLLTELYRVLRHEGLLEVTVPHGANDVAWESPLSKRPYYVGSFMQFSRPVMTTEDALPFDFQPKLVIIRLPDPLYQMIPQEKQLESVMTQRNIAIEMTAVLQAQKPFRKPANPEKIRLPRLVIEPLSKRPKQ